MKVGIYNRWLHTIGGGERYMLAIASHLAERFPVAVLTHQLVSQEELEAKLNLSLKKVELRYVPDLPERDLARYTADYDLFVNASFLSFLPSRARRGILLVYFPMPLGTTRRGRVVNWTAAALRRTLHVPEYELGFYPPERLGRTQFRWTGPRARLRYTPPGRQRSIMVSLLLGRLFPPDWGPAKVSLSCEGTPLATWELPATGSTFLRRRVRIDVVPGRQLSLDIEAEVTTPTSMGLNDPRALGVAVADVRVEHPRSWLYVGLRRFSPAIANRIARGAQDRPGDFLDTYQLIFAISRFTQGWIKRYWNRSSVVLYPPVDVESFSPLPKRKIILSVGRFFVGSHNKKHHVMVAAFKEMVGAGLLGWELHLVGAVAKGVAHQEYFESVRAAAANHPIALHPDADFQTLRRLYGEATIYWHACGYGEDENVDPVRFEHFGITTVEAMAAGCVPVVIGKAGQREVVQDGVNGFLWSSLDQLKILTRKVVENSILAERLRQGAMERSRAFSRESFNRQLDLLLPALGMEPEPSSKT